MATEPKVHWRISILVETRTEKLYDWCDCCCRCRRFCRCCSRRRRGGSYRTHYRRKTVAACQLSRWANGTKAQRSKIEPPRRVTWAPGKVTCKNCLRIGLVEPGQAREIWDVAVESQFKRRKARV